MVFLNWERNKIAYTAQSDDLIYLQSFESCVDLLGDIANDWAKKSF